MSGKLPHMPSNIRQGKKCMPGSCSLVCDDNHKLRLKKVLSNLALGVFAAKEVIKCYILQSTFVIYQLG